MDILDTGLFSQASLDKGYLMTSIGYRILTFSSKGEPAARPKVHTGSGYDNTVVTMETTHDKTMASTSKMSNLCSDDVRTTVGALNPALMAKLRFCSFKLETTK